MSDAIPDKALNLKFINADTDELKNVEFSFLGDRAVFKVGEGEQNHYQIPNDKKLMDSQFLIVVINGKYYIRDLGYVHTTRVKLDIKTEAQLQEGSIVDVGKVIHYHFDKLTHYSVPNQKATDTFVIMRPEVNNYEVD